jgi:hypothetical protein
MVELSNDEQAKLPSPSRESLCVVDAAGGSPEICPGRHGTATDESCQT